MEVEGGVHGREVRCNGDILGRFRKSTRGCQIFLELMIARRWNERVSHYDSSETSRGIRNVQEGKIL